MRYVEFIEVQWSAWKPPGISNDSQVIRLDSYPPNIRSDPESAALVAKRDVGSLGIFFRYFLAEKSTARDGFVRFRIGSDRLGQLRAGGRRLESRDDGGSDRILHFKDVAHVPMVGGMKLLSGFSPGTV
jgi:hypothetical protein